jgi:hypothetical protein
VLTASPPMASVWSHWLRPTPAEMAPFLTGPNKQRLRYMSSRQIIIDEFTIGRRESS